ncbi:MAG: TIGR04372 family glycosyltransferase [Rhodospirillales bacterium]
MSEAPPPLRNKLTSTFLPACTKVGIRRLLNVARSCYYLSLFAFIFAPVMLLAYIFAKRRFVVIDGGRIGPLATGPNIFMRLELAGCEYKHICICGQVANSALVDLMSRQIPIVVSPVIYKISTYALNIFTRFIDLPFIRYPDLGEYASTLNSAPSPLKFTECEEHQGRQALFEAGIDADDWFVCFHARTPIYLANAFPGQDWGYHDYRDCSIDNYVTTAIEIVKRGGFAIRMGAKGEEPYGGTDDPQIIDYANEFKSEFMDIYLAAHCKFLLCGGGSGIGALAFQFDRPVIWANLIPLPYIPWRSDDLIIPKLIWDEKAGRFLTFAEMHSLGLIAGINGGESRFYLDRGLRPVENSPEDLLDIALEMFDQVNGVARSNRELELQREFKKTYFSHVPDYQKASNIGSRFLAKHEFLMG